MAVQKSKHIKIEVENSEGTVRDITSYVSAFCYETPQSAETYSLPHAHLSFDLKADENAHPVIWRDNRVVGVEIKPEFWFLDTFRFESNVKHYTSNPDTGEFNINLAVDDGTWKAETAPGRLAAGLRWLWRFGWFRWLLRSFKHENHRLG